MRRNHPKYIDLDFLIDYKKPKIITSLNKKVNVTKKNACDKLNKYIEEAIAISFTK